MRSILLLPLIARCLVTIDVCISRMFVYMSVEVTVGIFVVVRLRFWMFSVWVLRMSPLVCSIDLTVPMS